MCHPNDFLREKMFNPKRVTKLAHLTVGLRVSKIENLMVIQKCEYTSASKYQRWASAILVRTSAIPQYCGQPNRLRNCRLKKLRNCNCGPLKFDFRNSATLRRHWPVLLLSVPFSSAQDDFKKKPTIFLEPFVSMENKNLP
jgi:hypothetical protein